MIWLNSINFQARFSHCALVSFHIDLVLVHFDCSREALQNSALQPNQSNLVFISSALISCCYCFIHWCLHLQGNSKNCENHAHFLSTNNGHLRLNCNYSFVILHLIWSHWLIFHLHLKSIVLLQPELMQLSILIDRMITTTGILGIVSIVLYLHLSWLMDWNWH